MLQLRVFGQAAVLTEVGRWLEDSGRARHIALADALRADDALLLATVNSDAADAVLEHLATRGVTADNIALARLDDLAPVAPGRAAASLIWADMLGQARRNARPVARYLVFMVVAGVIAGYGVITVNSILIVGAMAVSPDTLPIIAACVGLVSGRIWLVLRALATLAVGLAATGLAACAIAGMLRVVGLLPAGFTVGESSLSDLATVGIGTVGVALAAGVAAMLALETRASSAVGVAISVTTIPAAAYLGVAAAVGETGEAWGALAVLAVNVVMLVIGGTATLLAQRRLSRRADADANPRHAKESR